MFFFSQDVVYKFEELSSNSEDQLRQVNPTRVKHDMLAKYF